MKPRRIRKPRRRDFPSDAPSARSVRAKALRDTRIAAGLCCRCEAVRGEDGTVTRCCGCASDRRVSP